jgi:hypothetical protein
MMTYYMQGHESQVNNRLKNSYFDKNSNVKPTLYIIHPLLEIYGNPAYVMASCKNLYSSNGDFNPFFLKMC